MAQIMFRVLKNNFTKQFLNIKLLRVSKFKYFLISFKKEPDWVKPIGFDRFKLKLMFRIARQEYGDKPSS